MAVNIKLKRSAVQGNVPTTSQLELGELALNTYDGKAFFKKDVDGTQSIVELASTSSTVASASYAAYAALAGTASFATVAGIATYTSEWILGDFNEAYGPVKFELVPVKVATPTKLPEPEPVVVVLRAGIHLRQGVRAPSHSGRWGGGATLLREGTLCFLGGTTCLTLLV